MPGGSPLPLAAGLEAVAGRLAVGAGRLVGGLVAFVVVGGPP